VNGLDDGGPADKLRARPLGVRPGASAWCRYLSVPERGYRARRQAVAEFTRRAGGSG